jgi:hypothetical protein
VVLDGGTGASSMWTGAADWGDGARARSFVDPDLAPFLGSMGLVRAPHEAILATANGALRTAVAHDATLLDVAKVDGRSIGVVVDGNATADGAYVCRALNDAARARGLERDFFPMPTTLFQKVGEAAFETGELARLHDAPERAAWLGERLAAAIAAAGRRPEALLLPPSLGIETNVAGALRDSLGIPVGEWIGRVGSPSGLRFEARRNGWFRTAKVDVRRAKVTSIEASAARGGIFRSTLTSGDAVESDAVLVAVGGLLGGGLSYRQSEAEDARELPGSSRGPFDLTIRCPLPLGSLGIPQLAPGSLFGVAPETIAWPYVSAPLFERIGVLVDDMGCAAAVPLLYAAGDVVADRPRTWLEAAAAGVIAVRDILEPRRT